MIYPKGTEVQEKSGRVKIKISSDSNGSKWIGRARFNYMKAYKIDLTDSHRVFHMDGDLTNDNPKNLAAIKFSGIRYALTTSKVLWMPKAEKKLIKKYQLAVA